MSIRIGLGVGAGGAIAALTARRALNHLVQRLEKRLERAVRRLTAKAEQGGPLVKAALAGVKALYEGKSPFRALLSFGWTALKETLARIFGRRKRPTNIVEQTDVGAPRRLVYDQWTRFEDFPSFMKKVESVEQESDGKLTWKAKVFWSSRTWESTIVEQVPDKHIVWRSRGAKGHVDGTVSFHELSPNLTRVLLVLEYHPRGLVERTGNLWRAPGRRARLELKHFRRHVMAQALARPGEVQGWRGEIRDGEIVTTHGVR